MEGLDMDQLHQALRLASNVVSATFTACLSDYSYRDPVEYICPNLSDLIITAHRRCETLGPDITHCVYPSLTSLKVISGSEEFSFTHGIIPNLTKLLLRSECQLVSLTLHGISYNSRQLMDILHATPHLTKLDLCDVEHRAWNFLQIEDWLFKALTWSDRIVSQSYSVPGHLLPHLREFGIRIPGGKSEALNRQRAAAMLTMIESRCPSHTSTSSGGPGAGHEVGRVLQKLELGRLWEARLPRQYEQRLRRLESNGLVVTAL